MSKSERRKIVKKDTAKISKASNIHDLSDDVLTAVTGGNSSAEPVNIHERPDPSNPKPPIVLPESSTLNKRKTP